MAGVFPDALYALYDLRYVRIGEETGGVSLAEYVKPSGGYLTADEVTHTIISTYGQADEDIDLVLPVAAAGMETVIICGATVSGRKVNAVSNGANCIYLEGAPTEDGGQLGADAQAGYAIRLTSFKTGSSRWDWLAAPAAGAWSAGGSSPGGEGIITTEDGISLLTEDGDTITTE